MYRLEFRMALPKLPQKDLVIGKLICFENAKSTAYAATSGCPRFQYQGAEQLRGRGQLPQPKDAGLINYYVLTSPIYMPSVRGVEGNFYVVLPKWVKTKEGQRGDFGIHADHNVPGSAGCCVITMESHWKMFEQYMKARAMQGIKELPLAIAYTYS